MSAAIKWQDRPEKAQARNYLFSSTRIASKISIWMPAAECLDIRVALDRGILNKRSQIIAIERDPLTFAVMQKSLARIAKEHRFIHPPVAVNAPLHKVAVDQPIDFAFIDLCGTCDAPILGWIELVLAPKLTVGADVALTCTYAKRNSQFLQDSRDTLLTTWPAMYNQFAGSHKYFDRHNDDRDYEPIVLPAVLLKCALSRYDMVMRRPKCYGDDMPMIAFKLSDIRHHEGAPYYPSFSELYMRMTLAKSMGSTLVPLPIALSKAKSVTAKPTVDRSAAAQKAIATRRQRQASGDRV